MGFMALVATQVFAVSGRTLIHRDTHSGVTAQADRANILQVTQILDNRAMRIVTAAAVCQCKMGIFIFGVTTGACEDTGLRRRVSGMTSSATEVLLMFATRAGEETGNLFVATGAKRCFDLSGKNRRQRPMVLVTGPAVSGDHRSTVSLMTLQTVRLLPVLRMTITTGHLRMRSIISGQCGTGRCMAGRTELAIQPCDRN